MNPRSYEHLAIDFNNYICTSVALNRYLKEQLTIGLSNSRALYEYAYASDLPRHSFLIGPSDKNCLFAWVPEPSQA